MPPVGAVVTTVFVIAVPAILLMAVWAGVTAFRILFPDESLPFDPAAKRRQASGQGESVPVRLRDILEDQQARRTSVRAGAGGPPGPAANPLFDDLWLRRN